MYILAWRVLWLTMVNRKSPELPAKLVFTDTEIKLLERMVPLKDESLRKTVSYFLFRVARPGDYLHRTGNMQLGRIVLLRDMAFLTNIQIGYCLPKDCRELKVLQFAYRQPKQSIWQSK